MTLLHQTIERVRRQSWAYALASLVGPGTGFILLPLYTRFLSPAEYGLIALLEVIALVMGAVFSLGMPSIVQFYYTEPLDPSRRRRLMGTIVIAMTVTNMLLGLLVLGSGRLVLSYLLPSVPFAPYVPVVILTMLVDPYWALLGVVLQMQERASMYATLSTARYFLSMALRILFVVVLGAGVLGFITANLLTAMVGAAAAAFLLRRDVALAFEASEVRRALALGAPMVPNNLLSYSYRLIDRVVLERIATLDQIGLYYLAMRLAEVMRMCADVFVNAWRPVFFKEAADEMFTATIAPQVIRLASLAFIGGFLALSLFAREISAILLAPAYRDAYVFVPVLAAAFAVKGLYAFPYLTVWYRRKTVYVPFLTALTLLFSIAANVVLGRWWGPYGVAAALLLSHVVLSALMFAVARRLFRLAYPFRAMAGAGVTAVVLAAIAARVELGLIGAAVKAVLLCAYPVILIAAGWINRAELRMLLMPVAGLKVRRPSEALS